MNEVATLAVEPREGAGKGPARALRRQGRIPAVLYGEGKEATAIALDAAALLHELKQPGFFRRLYDLKLGRRSERALPRDVQRHPVTDAPLHVDFLRIAAGARVTVEVTVVFENEEAATGLKRGGVLNVVRHSIEVECPATAMPEAVHADLTGLDIGDSIHISHIRLPADVTPTILDRDFTVATIAAPTVVREEAAEAAAEAAEEIEEELAAAPEAEEA